MGFYNKVVDFGQRAGLDGRGQVNLGVEMGAATRAIQEANYARHLSPALIPWVELHATEPAGRRFKSLRRVPRGLFVEKRPAPQVAVPAPHPKTASKEIPQPPPIHHRG
jgi:hypothetical protein